VLPVGEQPVERVESFADVASLGMIGAEHALACFQEALGQLLRARVVAGQLAGDRETVQ
jgi:hypothetical protein